MSRYKIRRYAVIGAGNMGSGIAQKIATAGFPVVVVDLDQAKVERGLDGIRTTLAEGQERGLFQPAQVAEILARVTGTPDWDALAEADLVVEAVFEDLEVKRQVFRRLGEVARPEAILATNTSSFYVRDLAAVAPRPERVLGLHYFYHPAKNRLVEVVAHEGTSPAAFEAAWSAQEATGKTPIRSADAPGFVVNRYFVPWLNEAVRLSAEGVAGIATIEAAAKGAFGIGMGPFQLMNVTGIPIAHHAASTLGRELDPFYAPAPALAEQAARGEEWDLSGEVDGSAAAAVADRLLGVVFYVAAALVAEGVGTVEDVDIGARVGLRWSKGPFQRINEVGVAKAARLAEAAVSGHGLEVPALLRGARPTGIPLRLVSVAREDDLARVWLRRPDALNALNPEVMAQLEEAVVAARAGGGSGIVLGGSGKAFAAGADIKFFVDHLQNGGFRRIYEFTQRGHRLLAGFAGLPPAMVARVHGLSLGGGSEIALACDWIACSPKGSFGFPETGLGIYPGLGGCQRLARRVGLPLAKYLVYTGRPVDAETALALGLCDALAPFEELDAACRELAGRGPAPARVAPQAPPHERWQAVWEFFARHTVAEILSGQAPTRGEAVLEKAVRALRRKSANALALAERLFDEGSGLPLAAALEIELRYLEEMFAHPDALEGLSALLEGRRPAFQTAG